MGTEEHIVGNRQVDTCATPIDERYGGTDSGKSSAWVNAPVEFTRPHGGNLKDLRALVNIAINRLGALNAKPRAQMAPNKALQHSRIPGKKPPIAIYELGTRQIPNGEHAIREIPIRMYGTHKPARDSPDAFATNPPAPQTLNGVNNSQTSGGEGTTGESPETPIARSETDPEIDLTREMEHGQEWTSGDAITYLIRPKRPVSGRNQPGGMITAARGALANINGYKNGKGPGKLKEKEKFANGCIRCAARDRRWRQ